MRHMQYRRGKGCTGGRKRPGIKRKRRIYRKELMGCSRTTKCVVLAVLLILFAGGCGGTVIVSRGLPARVSRERIAKMGYSIQIGAFSDLDNAVQLTRSLESKGLNAYYFVHKSGHYKVRFGDFPTKDEARRRAEQVRRARIISDYFIVSPESYTVANERKSGRRHLRDDIIETAESFIGLPYRWGGSSPKEGFDCSGLTMAVYQLNGLKLPRSSWQQYSTGTPVKKTQLMKGDLVFFARPKTRRVSHVGIYAGNNRFIHAPGKGKRIRIDSLRNDFFAQNYMGARTYVR